MYCAKFGSAPFSMYSSGCRCRCCPQDGGCGGQQAEWAGELRAGRRGSCGQRGIHEPDGHHQDQAHHTSNSVYFYMCIYVWVLRNELSLTYNTTYFATCCTTGGAAGPGAGVLQGRDSLLLAHTAGGGAGQLLPLPPAPPAKCRPHDRHTGTR